MGIFRFAQGQLPPQHLVRSAPKSNLSSLVPERMNKIRSKMKAPEWPQDHMLICWRSKADIAQKYSPDVDLEKFMHD